MEISTLSIDTIHNHGELYANVLRSKHTEYPDNDPGFPPVHTDIYETPGCQWVVLHKFGQAHCGVRLIPTVNKCGIFTYPIKDMQNGLIEITDQDPLYDDAPVDSKIWEAGALFMAPMVAKRQYAQLFGDLAIAVLQTTRTLGAKKILGFGPQNWITTFERIKHEVRFIGPRINIDGRVHRCMSVDLHDNMH